MVTIYDTFKALILLKSILYVRVTKFLQSETLSFYIYKFLQNYMSLRSYIVMFGVLLFCSCKNLYFMYNMYNNNKSTTIMETLIQMNRSLHKAAYVTRN